MSSALLIATMFKVFLAGIQSKNVQHSRYVLALFTSLALSCADVIVVKLIVESSSTIAFAMCSIGNAAEITLAIIVHDRLMGRVG